MILKLSPQPDLNIQKASLPLPKTLKATLMAVLSLIKVQTWIVFAEWNQQLCSVRYWNYLQ